MYAGGSDPGFQARAAALIRKHVSASDRMATDAEVFQEILHRYRAINRTSAIQNCFDFLDDFVEVVYPIERQDVELAKSEALAYPQISARDALHVAIMKRYGMVQVLSFDTGFDAIPGLVRISA